MKSLLTILFIMSSCLTIAQNYAGKVIYEQEIDVSEFENSHSLDAGVFIGAAEASEGLEYHLLFNANESIFEIQNYMDTDENSMQSMAVRLGGAEGVFYKSSDAMVTLNETEALGADYIIMIPNTKYAWEITDESKKVGEFTVYKATASRLIKAPNKRLKDQTVEIEAWFAPDVPVCFGPKDVNGLPGLVLEATIGKITFRAKEVSLEKNPAEMPEIQKPYKGEMVTQNQLNDKVRALAPPGLFD